MSSDLSLFSVLQDLLKEMTTLEEKAKKEAQERKQSGRRMIIEEVEDEDEDEDVTEEIIVEKPDGRGNDVPLVNGHAEEAAPAAQPHARLSDPEPANEAEGVLSGPLSMACGGCLCACV